MTEISCGMTEERQSAGYRKCLICGGRTVNAHLGLDACRACTMFFKRTTVKSKRYICRKGDGNCVIVKADRFVCRRCRYDKCLQFGMRLDAEAGLSTSSPGTLPTQHDPAFAGSNLSNTTVGKTRNSTDNPPCPSCSKTSAFVPPAKPTTSTGIESGDLPLLQRIEQSYKTMCMARRATELASRASAIHSAPFGSDVPRAHATYESINALHRMTAAALFDFANTVFEEFRSFSQQDKWAMVRASHFCLIICEGCHRTEQHGGREKDIVMISPLTYFRINEIEKFFYDAPNTEFHGEATEVLRTRMKTVLRLLHPQMIEAALDDKEFLALVGLILWCNDVLGSLSEAVQRAAEKHRSRIFHELHLHYRQSLGLREYSGRIGRIMLLLYTCQEVTQQIVKEFEVFRLLDIINETTFAYQFCSQTTVLP